MHNIVLHISIYIFPWLHVLCDLRSNNNDRKHAFSAISICFLDIIFRWVVCLNMSKYAHNVSMKMTLCVWAANIPTFTSN